MTPIKNVFAIAKTPLSSRLKNLSELHDVLSKWRISYPENFRVDGYEKISPANPSQWIFFEINDFKENLYEGKDLLGVKLTGLDWNGIYYLSGATRSASVDLFIQNYQKCKGDPNQFFSLCFTKGKEGNRKKMRIELLSQDAYLSQGWFCKKFN